MIIDHGWGFFATIKKNYTCDLYSHDDHHDYVVVAEMRISLGGKEKRRENESTSMIQKNTWFIKALDVAYDLIHFLSTLVILIVVIQDNHPQLLQGDSKIIVIR